MLTRFLGGTTTTTRIMFLFLCNFHAHILTYYDTDWCVHSSLLLPPLPPPLAMLNFVHASVLEVPVPKAVIIDNHVKSLAFDAHGLSKIMG